MFEMSVICVILAIAAIVTRFFIKTKSDRPLVRERVKIGRKVTLICFSAFLALFFIFFIFSMVITVPAGHASVGTLFGKVYDTPCFEGIHFVNPLSKWASFDCRQKVLDQTASVPSMDQLQTKIDVSVKFRAIKEVTPKIFSETGNLDTTVKTHLVPKLRSLLREQGKSVKRAEDFYLEEIQQRLQNDLKEGLAVSLAPKGLDIQEILLRDIDLPPEIDNGVKAKKIRDQEAEREKAELRRFETEQQKKVKSAKAEKQAADLEAEKIRVLAEAKAYEIRQINAAIAKNPSYIKLEALKALQAISKDPTAKLYFLNGDSPQPLPLMHLGK